MTSQAETWLLSSGQSDTLGTRANFVCVCMFCCNFSPVSFHHRLLSLQAELAIFYRRQRRYFNLDWWPRPLVVRQIDIGSKDQNIPICSVLSAVSNSLVAVSLPLFFCDMFCRSLSNLLQQPSRHVKDGQSLDPSWIELHKDNDCD